MCGRIEAKRSRQIPLLEAGHVERVLIKSMYWFDVGEQPRVRENVIDLPIAACGYTDDCTSAAASHDRRESRCHEPAGCVRG